MLYGQNLCLRKTQGMEKKLRAASNQGSSQPPGACSGGEHLYPGSLAAPTKPWAAGVTDMGLLVPRRIPSVQGEIGCQRDVYRFLAHAASRTLWWKTWSLWAGSVKRALGVRVGTVALGSLRQVVTRRGSVWRQARECAVSGLLLWDGGWGSLSTLVPSLALQLQSWNPPGTCVCSSGFTAVSAQAQRYSAGLGRHCLFVPLSW